jgi:hypothetical protein
MIKVSLNKWFGPNLAIFVMLLLVILLAIALPFLFIFALNTLFPVLAIPMTLETWCAVWILDMVFKIRADVNK